MPLPLILTADERAEFEQRGIVRLPGINGAQEVAAMAEAIWSDLARRLGIPRDRSETWTVIRPAQFQRLVGSGAFAAMGSPGLRGVADALLGAGAWTPPRRWGQPLVTLPAQRWDLPRVMWHFDLPGDDYRAPLPGLRLFTLLAPLGPGGGGTLYVAGSHRLALDIARVAGPVPSAALRNALKAKHPWFADLCAAPGDEVRGFMGQPISIGGVEVAVEEMTGEAGDLIVMHPLLLHGLAHNASRQPRLMLTAGVWRGSGNTRP